MQKPSCTWDVAFKAMFVEGSHRCMCWPGESSPGNPLGSCSGYRFSNILGSFNILKSNLCCCSLHFGSPRNSTSAENPNKPKLQESLFFPEQRLLYFSGELYGLSFTGATSAVHPLCVSAAPVWYSSTSSSRLITQEISKRFL